MFSGSKEQCHQGQLLWRCQELGKVRQFSETSVDVELNTAITELIKALIGFMTMEDIHSDSMICGDCFRAQSEGRSDHRCHNVKCHFYNLATGRPEETAAFGSSSRVSRRAARLPYLERNSYRSTDSALGEDDLWTYKPSTSRPQSTSDISSQPSERLQPGAPSSPNNSRMQRLAKERHMLEDDPFYKLNVSPMTPFVMQNGYYSRVLEASDVDSGVSSPFSRPSSSDFWLEPSSSGPGTPSDDAVFDMSLLSSTLNTCKCAPGFDHPSPSPSPIENSLVRKFLPSAGPGQNDPTYSRKVFLGGLPPNLDQEYIKGSFNEFGAVTIDWPQKIHNRSTIPKGYAFLLFQEENSVHKLVLACVSAGDKMFTYINYMSATGPVRKMVQIKPWRIADSCHTSGSLIDYRKAMFVGGVPRPLTACELAEVMTDKFGPVSFAAIDCDVVHKYPKGAGCVVFTTLSSFVAAVSSRHMQLSRAGIEKKIELLPYILNDQLCDVCDGVHSNGKPAPFFCVTCLHYYCDQCWATVHSLPGRQSHPMIKIIYTLFRNT